MKVIAMDNLNRDYYPERLITVSISEDEAKRVAEVLNSIHSSEYYSVVEDDYTLDLQSMYDVVQDKTPDNFYIEQYGLKAFSKENIVRSILDCM